MPLPTLASYLAGRWIGTYSGFIHDLPPDMSQLLGETRDDRARPPQLPAYYRYVTTPEPTLLEPNPAPQTEWVQTDGYYVFAALLCMRFGEAAGGPAEKPSGPMEGILRLNRGGKRLLDREVNGHYTLSYNALDVIEGEFWLMIPEPVNPSPSTSLQIQFRFLARNADEIAWLWWASIDEGQPDRGNATQGILRRVSY